MELKIEYIAVDDLKPYERNTRKHGDEDVEGIIKSIEKCGFNDPIGIWSDKNIIVEGHGRLMAAKQLGMETVPCIRLDHLDDKGRREYAILHNATAELSIWDEDFLSMELPELNLEDFDFGIDNYEEMKNDTDYEIPNERERTFNSVNLLQYDENRTEGFYQMPIIKSVDYIPNDLIGFNYIKNTPEYEKTVHFFIDDYQFERIWNNPEKIIDRIMPFSASLTPDFSLYMDMPIAMKIWNIYRSRLIGQIMQDNGIIVIPTLSWAEPETYSFCFDGLENGGTYAVSTVGVMKNKEAQKIWRDGMDEAIKRLNPKNLICYGSTIDYDFNKINVVYFDARKIGG